MKITKITRRQFDGEVFNIATPPQMNYFANGKLVHNCYQGSTKKGIHAPLAKIEAVARLLGEMQVFEAAIGGGEPTAHPDFPAILRAFKDHGVVPNFTTFSDKWLNDEKIVEAVVECVGGIGVSCLDAKGLALVDKIRAKLDQKHTSKSSNVKVMAQHVVGSVPLMQTTDFITAAFDAHVPVLLLGFKEVGFGAKYRRFDNSSFETFLTLAVKPEDHWRWARLSIDTALLNQYPNIPAILGAPEALVTAREGAFSCYIDATTDQVGASSYVKPSEMLPLPMDVEGFKRVYATF